MTDPDRMRHHIGRWITRRLEQDGRTAAELARAIGADKATVSRMRAGKSSYGRRDHLQATAEFFGVRTQDIYRDALAAWEQETAQG